MTTNLNKSTSTESLTDLDKMENNLAAELRSLCDENGKEIEPQKSADILHKLGRIYFERSKAVDGCDDGRSSMVSLIRGACLLNAAIIRKPHNLQSIKDDLKTLCSQVLISAEASDKNADLIGQSELVRRDIDTMRDMVRQRLHDIQSSGKKITDEKEKEANKISVIKSLQEDITSSYTKIMADLLRFCQTVIGNPPSKFALVGMGSLARKEITPYSDFEHIFVLEENVEQRSDYKAVLNYFRWLSVIFQIVVINLQETIIPCVNIPSLRDQQNKHWFYDGVTKHGICFDSMMPHACKFPIGRIETTKNNQSTTELIKSVDEMLKYLSVEEDLKNGYHLKDILTKVCYVGGDKSVFDKFQSKVYSSVRKKNYDEKIISIKQLLVEDLDNFATRSNFLHLTSTSFNLKKDFYRSSTLFISALGQLHNVEASSCFDISEKLEERNLISKRMKHYQMYAVALACELRLKWYMKQNEQNDFIESKDGSQDPIQLLLETMEESSVIKYFQITYALQCNISKTFGLKKIHFYTDPKLINCKLYYRFRKTKKFYNFIQTYFKTDFDKTARLYASEEIMKQLEQESKQNSLFNAQACEDGMKKEVLDLGLWFQSQNSYDEALELFQIYLDIEKKEAKGNNQTAILQHHNVLNRISDCLMGMHKPAEAITNLKQMMIDYEKASPDVSTDVYFATLLSKIGLCLLDMQKPREAIIYLKKSKKIQKKVSFDISTDVVFATTLNNIGQCFLDMHEYSEAITYLKRSMIIKEKATPDVSTDVRFAVTLNNIGLCLMEMQKPGEATTYLKRSMTIYKKTSPNLSQDVSFAKALNNIGLCLMEMHKPGEAIKYLQRSKAISDEASLDLSVDVYFATALTNIGSCLLDMNKPGEAISYLQRSMTIFEKASVSKVNLAKTLNSIGLCLLNMNKPNEAITYLLRSMRVKENASTDVSKDVSFATTLNNIGSCFLFMNKPNAAIPYLKRSLSIFENASLDDSKDDRFIQALNKLGMCLIEMHKPGEAFTYQQKSIKNFQNTSYNINMFDSFITMRIFMKICLMKIHKPDETIIYLQRSMIIFEKRSPDISMNVLFAAALKLVGLCLLDLHKTNEASTYLHRSMVICNKVSLD